MQVLVASRLGLALCAWGVLLAFGLPVTLAQYTEDEQTRDHAERDRLYQRSQLGREDDGDRPGGDDNAELEAYLARADRLIRDLDHRSATTDHYKVQTDDPRLSPAAAAALLERFRGYFSEFWSEVELEPHEERARVFLFYSFYKFNQLLAGDFRFSMVRPKGHYGSMFDVITLHTDADTPGAVADALVHEVAHQLIDRQLQRHRHQPSIWLSEGMASYFGYTYLDGSGTFRTGEVGGKEVQLFRRTKTRPSTEGKERLKSFRAALKSKDRPEGSYTDRVLSIGDPSRYYGENAQFHYTTSWVLVHFLLHGEDGKHRDAFVRYLALEAEGQGEPDALYAEIGLSGTELDEALAAHARSIKTR